MGRAFSQILKQLCDQRRVSLSQLARDIKIPYKTVAFWVGGNSLTPRDPSALTKLSSYFGCSTHFLLFGEEDPHYITKPRDISEPLSKLNFHAGEYHVTIKKIRTKNPQERVKGVT